MRTRDINALTAGQRIKAFAGNFQSREHKELQIGLMSIMQCRTKNTPTYLKQSDARKGGNVAKDGHKPGKVKEKEI